MSEYKPWLLHCMNARWNPNAGGINEIAAYDYMGSAEYEYGAVPTSIMRIRARMEAGDLFSIVALNVCPPKGFVQGDTQLYALLPNSVLDGSANAVQRITDGIAAIIAGKHCCKERPEFDEDFAAWHDLEHDFFFAPNLAYLQLIHSALKRGFSYSKTVDKELRIGDIIELATVLNGKSFQSTKTMGTQEGAVVAILEDTVVIKRRKTYRMPFAFILTHKAEMHHGRPEEI